MHEDSRCEALTCRAAIAAGSPVGKAPGGRRAFPPKQLFVAPMRTGRASRRRSSRIWSHRRGETRDGGEGWRKDGTPSLCHPFDADRNPRPPKGSSATLSTCETTLRCSTSIGANPHSPDRQQSPRSGASGTSHLPIGTSEAMAGPCAASRFGPCRPWFNSENRPIWHGSRLMHRLSLSERPFEGIAEKTTCGNAFSRLCWATASHTQNAIRASFGTFLCQTKIDRENAHSWRVLTEIRDRSRALAACGRASAGATRHFPKQRGRAALGASPSTAVFRQNLPRGASVKPGLISGSARRSRLCRFGPKPMTDRNQRSLRSSDIEPDRDKLGSRLGERELVSIFAYHRGDTSPVQNHG